MLVYQSSYAFSGICVTRRVAVKIIILPQ